MKIALAVLVSTTLLVAQEPPKPAPAPAPAKTGQGTDAKKQEPGKVEPKTGEQKTGEQKTGEQKTGEAKPGDSKTGTQDPKPTPTTDTPNPGPQPRGADPADLRAIQSAEAMLEAEGRLRKLIKEGKITGLDKVLPFDELTSWPYEDGLKGMPKRVKDLDGKKVLMTGFMLPIDEVQNIKEFLLVQSLWSCCYGSPPDINGIVRVVMPKGKTTDYFFDPLKLIGKFKVEATVIDGYCVDIFQLELESLEPLRTEPAK